MSRMNMEDTKIGAALFERGFKLQPTVRAMSAALTLTRESTPMQVLAPASALALNLPALEAGLTFLIINNAGGAFALTPTQADATTRGTIAQGSAALLVCDGNRWWNLPLA